MFRSIGRRNRDVIGEGPLWVARQNALYWVDILGKRLNRLSLDDDSTDGWDLPEMTGWLIERSDQRGFIIGMHYGFAELDLEPFAIRHIANPEPDRPTNRLNDAKADSAGRIWAGTMPLAGDVPTGGLYRLDADRSVHKMDEGYIVANGPAFSPDERWLYHTDTGRGLIYRFPLHLDGRLGPRQAFIAFEEGAGKPDGMTVDADGGLWVAHWGSGLVSRFYDDGRLDRRIALPTSQITSCTFAGDALDRMFVTSASWGQEKDPLAGALFEVETGRKGLMPNLSGIAVAQ